MAVRAARLLRSAGYVAFTSTAEIPDQRLHSAIASTYAHVTAPLRRVCDCYANEVLMALCAGSVVNHHRNGDDIRAVIQLSDPAVISTLTPPPPLGTTLKVRLVEVDPARRHVRFEAANA